jgi:hypothetical protein
MSASLPASVSRYQRARVRVTQRILTDHICPNGRQFIDTLTDFFLQRSHFLLAFPEHLCNTDGVTTFVV